MGLRVCACEPGWSHSHLLCLSVCFFEFNIEVKGEHMQRLQPLEFMPETSKWLVDEIINFYMVLLQVRHVTLCREGLRVAPRVLRGIARTLRGVARPCRLTSLAPRVSLASVAFSGLRSGTLRRQKRDDRRVAAAKPADSAKGCYFFNSFFINKLLDEGRGYDYNGVSRWTKRLNIFSKKHIFFPVNISNQHWCMAVVHMDGRIIQYYDSMGGEGREYLEVRCGAGCYSGRCGGTVVRRRFGRAACSQSAERV